MSDNNPIPEKYRRKALYGVLYRLDGVTSYAGGEIDGDSIRAEIDPREDSDSTRAFLKRVAGALGFSYATEGEFDVLFRPDTEHALATLRAEYPNEIDPEATDPAHLSEGDRVKVVQTDPDDEVTGTVTGLKIEAGRYAVTLEVLGSENPSYAKDGHKATVTFWERSGRTFYRLDPADADDEPAIRTDGGRPRSLGQARAESQRRQFCGACEAGVEHTADECKAARTDDRDTYQRAADEAREIGRRGYEAARDDAMGHRDDARTEGRR